LIELVVDFLCNMWYYYHMENNKDYQNIKAWHTTIADLRQIYALTGEKMVAIVDRLVKQELERIRKEKEQSGNSVTRKNKA